MKKIMSIVVLTGLLLVMGCTTGAVGGNGSAEATASQVQPGPNDAAITSAVRAAFQQDEMLAATDIDVVTEEGVVMLDGRLPSGRAANRAVSLARATEGVRRVISRLELGSQ